MLPIFTAPTTDQHHRTLLASYETWKIVVPRLAQPISRVIEQQVYRNKNQVGLIRIEFSIENAAKVIEAATQ